jgi:hypothetical protein
MLKIRERNLINFLYVFVFLSSVAKWQMLLEHLRDFVRKSLDTLAHGLINYIDTKAKRRHLEKLTYNGTLRQMFHLSENPLPS